MPDYFGILGIKEDISKNSFYDICCYFLLFQPIGWVDVYWQTFIHICAAIFWFENPNFSISKIQTEK